MEDIRELINTILSDGKISGTGVYSDEPILFTASQMKNYTPPQYLQMRKLADVKGSYFESDARVFFRQGKFMENFEDSFDYHGEFFKYYPTYQAMNNFQLRGYFSWRTDVRRGNVSKTSLSFAFVYIYELLNQIGVSSPEDGFYKLKSFTDAYIEFDKRISYYVRLWLRDYVIYYNLDKSLLSASGEDIFDDALLTLINFKAKTAGEVFTALNSLSAYNLGNSRFYKLHPDEVVKAVFDVYSSLADYCSDTPGKSVYENLFGSSYIISHEMFRAAVFFEEEKHPDCVYEINEIYKFNCSGGRWTCERVFCDGKKSAKVGELLKNIDYRMRRKFGFKSTLQPAKSEEYVLKIIDESIDRLLKSLREAARPKIEIDLSKLGSIRDAALVTQEMLIVDEEEAEEANVEEAAAESTLPPDECPLESVEADFVARLLRGESCDSLLAENGLLLSLVVDSVNEKLFDLFGDTVIVFGASAPEIIEDYADELKGIIGQ